LRTSAKDLAMPRHLAISLVVLLSACGTPTDQDGVPALLTELPRPLSTNETRIIDAANAFAFELLRESTRKLPTDSNAFLSPLSASMALGMALNGAKGETFTAMQTTLRLTGMTEQEINEGYRDLVGLLGTLDSRTQIKIANSMWGHQTFPLDPIFIDKGKTYFDAKVETVDFASPSALTTINDWVKKATNEKIPKLIDQIAREEILFLVNAIYFKGTWRQAFDPKDTRDGPFQGADGRARNAALMSQTDTLRYDETPDFQAVELLYGNGSFAMTVLLPKPGRTPADVLEGLTPAAWSELRGRFQVNQVHVTLPRFRMDYSRKLAGDLTALGMGIAFDRERADFSGIADVGSERLFLTRVDQKTFVDVNEEGTEAAAATAVGVGVTSAPLIIEMRVDRPFLFAIHERLSGAVLFLGVMNVAGE
jgi:serpin B